MRLLVIATVFVAACFDNTYVPYGIDGRLEQDNTGEHPLAGMTVAAYDPTLLTKVDETTSDTDGHFQFQLAPGQYLLCARGAVPHAESPACTLAGAPAGYAIYNWDDDAAAWQAELP